MGVLTPAYGKIKVVSTLPEFAWAAKEIGGDEVEVLSLLNGTEDPHYMDASPAFVFKVSKADVLIKNGMQLETGWLPKVLQMSGNAEVQPGEKGNCDASKKVEKLEVIDDYDRSKGDIHPAGNPHYTLSAKAMAKAGEQIKECLEKASGKNFSKGLAAYRVKMEELFEKQKSKLNHLKGKNLMVYHREFSYFIRDYGLKSAGSLEEVPGVLPSASYLSKVASLAKKEKVALALASSVSPKKYLQKFKELSGVDYLMLQIHPMRRQSYIEFYNKFANEIGAHGK